LGKIGHTHPCAPIHRQGCDLEVAQDHCSFVRAQKSNDHVEGGCFAGSVRTEKTHDLPGRNAQGNAINDPAPMVGLAESLGDEIERFGAQGFSSG